MRYIDPQLIKVKISDLRPTQITVGLQEVQRKAAEWRQLSQKAGAAFLGKNMIPVVEGVEGRFYIIDHHHMALALHQENVDTVLVDVRAELSKLDEELFWIYMDKRNWLHPFDAKGKRRAYTELPKSVKDLVDDPYRSLAGEVRRSGGFAKTDILYVEFMWADFFRKTIDRKLVIDSFDKALAEALALAKKKKTKHLPGWCGPSD